LAAFSPNLRHDIGSRSSTMRLGRSPSITRSTHMKISLYTVCGHAYPHHSRPATAVNRNSDIAEITSSPVR